MKRVLVATAVLIIGIAAAVGAAAVGGDAVAAPAYWMPPQQLTWYWQLQGTVKVEPVQVTDMDGFDNTAATVAQFHQDGQRVICYLDVGTAENFRSDYGSFPANDLGNTNGWPGERWLNVADLAGLEPIMDARIAMCQQKGFDAVEPDNQDGWENSTGFTISGAQQQAYNHWIADDIHSHGMAAFGKNDPEQASQSVSYNDGQIEEQDVQYGDDVSPYLKAGKPVLDAEYQSETCSTDGQMQAQFDLNLTGATFKPCFAASPQGPPIGGTSSTTSTSSTSSTATSSSSTGTTTATTTSSTTTQTTSSSPTTTTSSTTTMPPSQKPVNTKAPTLSGTAKQGDQFKTSNGTWTGSPGRFTYAWRRCQSNLCQTVRGATRQTYSLGSGDVGYRLQAVVTASNKAGSASAVTGESAVVVKKPKARAARRRVKAGWEMNG